ncbi:MAG: DUF3810 domain-containing protein [Saprospiraceae bacterium]|nr:DUF3810 domain-containing protein [Saprospiraceae bacterium]
MMQYISKKKLLGVVLGLVAIFIHLTMGPNTMESWYAGFYKAVRYCLDYTIGLLGIPFTYVLALAALWWFYRILLKFWRDSPRKVGSWVALIVGVLSMLGWLVFFFYTLWGFNYDRLRFDERISWSAHPPEEEAFIAECNEQIRRLASQRSTHLKSIDESLLKDAYRLLETVIRQDAIELAAEYGYHISSPVQCRQLIPKGILLRFGTAGFYNPLTGECNIDKGLHPLQKPFVMAHEFFHGAGVTGEGDCNFLAYVLCRNSQLPFIRYSGELGYWRYLRGSFRRLDKDQYESSYNRLPKIVRSDIEAIDTQMAAYPDIAPRLRDQMYSAYLKSNKIHDGLANYGRVVELVLSWRSNKYALP